MIFQTKPEKFPVVDANTEVQSSPVQSSKNTNEKSSVVSVVADNR